MVAGLRNGRCNIKSNVRSSCCWLRPVGFGRPPAGAGRPWASPSAPAYSASGTPVSSQVQSVPSASSASSAAPPASSAAPLVIDGFVRVTDLDPSIVVDLKYATTDNFTHQKVYPTNVCVLRLATAQKPAKTNAQLQTMGCRIKV